MAESLPPDPTPSAPKQWKSDGSVKIYKSVSARSPLTKSKKEKIIERAAIWKCVSVHWRAQCNAKWPRTAGSFSTLHTHGPAAVWGMSIKNLTWLSFGISSGLKKNSNFQTLYAVISEAIKPSQLVGQMNKFFLPTSRTVLPIFQTFCLVEVHFAQTVVHFAQFRPGKGVFWGAIEGVLCTYISPKGVLHGWVKNRGWWWYSGQSKTPSGQNETHLGNLYVMWAKGL